MAVSKGEFSPLSSTRVGPLLVSAGLQYAHPSLYRSGRSSTRPKSARESWSLISTVTPPSSPIHNGIFEESAVRLYNGETTFSRYSLEPRTYR
jgi:hypothetical protein